MRRRYTDARRAEALALLQANGGNLDRTSRALGIPRSTLQGWRDQPEIAPAALLEERRAALAGDLFDLAAHLFELLPEKLETASGHALLVGLGIVLDKIQALTGTLPAEAPEERWSDEERAERAVALLDRARARRDAVAAGNGAAPAADVAAAGDAPF